MSTTKPIFAVKKNSRGKLPENRDESQPKLHAVLWPGTGFFPLWNVAHLFSFASSWIPRTEKLSKFETSPPNFILSRWKYNSLNVHISWSTPTQKSTQLPHPQNKKKQWCIIHTNLGVVISLTSLTIIFTSHLPTHQPLRAHHPQNGQPHGVFGCFCHLGK